MFIFEFVNRGINFLAVLTVMQACCFMNEVRLCFNRCSLLPYCASKPLIDLTSIILRPHCSLSGQFTHSPLSKGTCQLLQSPGSLPNIATRPGGQLARCGFICMLARCWAAFPLLMCTWAACPLVFCCVTSVLSDSLPIVNAPDLLFISGRSSQAGCLDSLSALLLFI